MIRAGWLVVVLAACAPAEQELPKETVALPLPVVGAAPAGSVRPAPADGAVGTEGRALDVPARDPRPASRRAPATLAREVAALDRLVALTPRSAADRPLLLRRAAETWVALRKAGTARAGTNAIDRYTTLAQENPGDPHADEVRYYLGLESEIAGDLSAARRSYFELIMRHPGSKLVPFAYFAFGEMFLREAKADPAKWPLAEASYKEVLKYPGTALAPHALWRLGQAYDEAGDPAAAQATYAKLRNDFPGSDAVVRIGERP